MRAVREQRVPDGAAHDAVRRYRRSALAHAHLAGELFARRAGVKVAHVPHKGAVPAISGLLGGQTDFMPTPPQAAISLVKAGKLPVPAVTSAKRLPVLGDVPTVAESGYAGFEAVDWKVLVASAGTRRRSASASTRKSSACSARPTRSRDRWPKAARR